MNSVARSAVEIVLAVGVSLVLHSVGWGFITLGLSAIIIESVAAYWNQR